MKLIALIENKSNSDLIGEHGLAIHIEYNGKHYLLDTGASDYFTDNALKLGVDLSRVDAAILSHSHYDHSGGYNGFFYINKRANVYVRKEAKELCYGKIGPFKRYIGIPKDILNKYADRFIYVHEDYKINEGVWLISHKTDNLEARGKKAHMYRMTNNGLKPDDFHHEQSLVFDTDDGLVILNSCSHGGIDNIVEEVKATFEGKKVLAVMGGFHLMGFTGTSSMSIKSEEVEALGKRLVDLGVEHIYTCHCTGDPAYKILKKTLGDRVEYFSTGTVVEL
ncbi:metallo-beta-lactamase [Clostridium botulinum B2 128]|uniref:MBL fold metallo-hydrolase n=1 Tax=Clostridium botulinum TaxID=1491 RepID=UPI000581CDB9|nr:MBL fold metallo-hydrolase [Clostridium botulinum]KEI76371.1 metallo-beta-lactamase [Clostridium botulinum B2 128]KEI90051.1 metallo-beta-lactamase [Clostridium botulinum B2 433]NFI44144.1 MBL fold metallo-hydrolase [Clostridium botulinum]NFI76295.1 MBL fold metallo-hydrolase [Clostridium botulinum]NFJ37050.1 MBL fold metallo-hydrolase [Clostridium botulinum]